MYVCEGSNMGESWPWESTELSITNLTTLYNLTWIGVKWPSRWILKNTLVEHNCIIRPTHGRYRTQVGKLDCEAG